MLKNFRFTLDNKIKVSCPLILSSPMINSFLKAENCNSTRLVAKSAYALHSKNHQTCFKNFLEFAS